MIATDLELERNDAFGLANDEPAEPAKVYIDAYGFPTREFLLAGNAIFTIKMPGTANDHYTFRINQSEATDDYPAAFWLAYLTGSDNTRDYTSLGKINPSSNTLKLNRKCKYNDDTFVVKLARRLLARLLANDTGPIRAAGCDVTHAGSCCRCGRLLTTPASIAAGIGPICAKGGRD